MNSPNAVWYALRYPGFYGVTTSTFINPIILCSFLHVECSALWAYTSLSVPLAYLRAAPTVNTEIKPFYLNLALPAVYNSFTAPAQIYVYFVMTFYYYNAKCPNAARRVRVRLRWETAAA